MLVNAIEVEAVDQEFLSEKTVSFVSTRPYFALLEIKENFVAVFSLSRVK